MTFGALLTQARVALGDAKELVDASSPSDAVDLLAVTAARAAVYRQLARLTGQLIPPAAGRPRERDGALDRAVRLRAFRNRLQSIAAGIVVPAHTVPASPAACSLSAAADRLGGAADILAGHVLPTPGTPEGIAIRNGGGVASAAVDLARITFDAIAVDLSLERWLERCETTIRPLGDPLAAAIQQITTGTLPTALGAVTALGPLVGPPLLHDLSAIPAVTPLYVPADTAAAAAEQVRTARNWLWQNPREHRTIHMRLATQLGLAATLPDDGNPHIKRWRQAATFAIRLEGPRADGDADAAARRLADALAWSRDAVERDPQTRMGEVAAELPLLAEALRVGLQHAVARGEIFLRRSRFKLVPEHGVRRPTSRWQRATPSDPEIIALRDALTDLVTDPQYAGPNQAGYAFRAAAPRTTDAPALTRPAATSEPKRVHRTR